MFSLTRFLGIFRGGKRRAPKPLGARGEDLAARALRRAGYVILARNVRLGRYEIDIIARHRDTTVFVEVRTRTSGDPVPPEETVNPTKQLHIMRAARIYIARERNPEMYYRFDVVAVVVPETGAPQVTIYADAFR
jgi:putative endonuclease